MRPVPKPILALVVGGLLLAACSGDDDVTAPDTTSPTSTSVAETTTTTATSVTTTTTEATTTTTEPADPTEREEPPGPLEAGSVGRRTRALQEALADQGYDPGPVDGRFGGRVQQAVWAFQALRGLPKDGIVTPEIEKAILAREPQAMLRPDAGPTHTEVDLSRQVMIVWRDGEPVLIAHVSTGSEVPYCEETEVGRNCGDAVTPVGSFAYERRISGWRHAPLGGLYNPVYFVGGIAVHGANSVPNHPASHGCVRIDMGIAEYFPDLVANGDPVVVFRS